MTAVAKAISAEVAFEPVRLRAHAPGLDKAVFKNKIAKLIERLHA